jgi:hypothetical protein
MTDTAFQSCSFRRESVARLAGKLAGLLDKTTFCDGGRFTAVRNKYGSAKMLKVASSITDRHRKILNQMKQEKLLR